MEYYSLSSLETLKNLNVLKAKGLSKEEVNKRQIKYGKNKLESKNKKSFFKIFIEQFSDFMVIILLIAAIISFVTSFVEKNNDYIDSIIILIIVSLNAIMGTIQEFKAEQAIEDLKKLSVPKAHVIRNSKEKKIDAEDLVPGDILILKSGDLIPADARILESYNLKTEESALTGESFPIEKNSLEIYKKHTPIAERKNMVFATSNVISGRALAVVTEIGMSTQVGKIAMLINEEDSPKTPLQEKLAKTSKVLGVTALIVCFIIFLLGLVQSTNPIEMFMISISLAVAAIPEGLPAVVTIVLALGVRRMVSNRAIIRKLPAVETLGSASIICTDKTGTLTQNKMQVVDIYSKNSEVLKLATLCSNTSGDPTEKAIIEAAEEKNFKKTIIDKNYPKIYEIPFDSSSKIMTTIHKFPNNKYRVITKGAPDVLLKKCIKNNLDLKNIEIENNLMAKKALRVIAVAYKDIDYVPNSKKNLANELIFLGLIGLKDPIRTEAKRSVKECLDAGIKPVMITGDNVVTAMTIAKELGIMTNNQKSLTGYELEHMTQKELEKSIFNYAVFARVSPEHKVRIVKAFQRHKEVVAMTGDGVNDAPALKAADIGCAMGISGTDVAKSAADMILTDDNFSTIVEAIKEGRGIFENIKKTIRFLLSSNTGEILTVLVAFLMKMPTPLLAIQLLWVNLVTDSFPALALGVEPVDDSLMRKKPIDKRKSLLSDGMGFSIILEGIYIGSISILAFVLGKIMFDINIARTMTFSVLSLSQIVHSFNVRSEKSIFKTNIFKNMKIIYSFIICTLLQICVVSIPILTNIFKTSYLNFNQWLIVSILSISPLIIVELEKSLSKVKVKKVEKKLIKKFS